MFSQGKMFSISSVPRLRLSLSSNQCNHVINLIEPVRQGLGKISLIHGTMNYMWCYTEPDTSLTLLKPDCFNLHITDNIP